MTMPDRNSSLLEVSSNGEEDRVFTWENELVYDRDLGFSLERSVCIRNPKMGKKTL